MKKYLVQIDDEEGGRGRKIYLTSWGASVWKDYALRLEKNEAKIKLTDYLKSHEGATGRIINEA